MNELVGKYINGYKITNVMQDPFIKGQINILTDGFVANWQGDRDVIVYRISDSEPPERPQSVKNIERKTLEQLFLDMMHLADYQCKRANQLEEVIEELRERSKLERKTALSLNQHYAVSIIDSVLQILDKVKEK